MVTLSWDQVLAFRLDRQYLQSRAPGGSMLDVAGSLCGARAQLPSTAELTLWARVEGLRLGEVEHALQNDRSLVKTWVRNRLHVIPSTDLAGYCAALRPRPEGPGDAWFRLRGVTREQYEAIIANVPRALDGRPRTRERLADRVAELGGADLREAVLFSWGGVLKQSARFGDLCFGPPRGRNVTFVRPDRWLRRTIRADPEPAGRQLVRRFFAAYGPATMVDFGHWIEDPTRGRALVRAARAEFSDVEIDGRPALALTSDLPQLRAARLRSGVRLLPAFDQYVTSAYPREAIISADRVRQVFRQQGWISPVLLVDGRIAGTWSHELSDGAIRIEVETFGPLRRRARQQLDQEAQRLARFLGGSCTLSVAGQPDGVLTDGPADA